MTLARVNEIIDVFWQEHGHLARRWIAALAGLALVGIGLWYYTTLPTTLNVAVGPAGSERETFVRNLAKALADGRKPIRIKLVVVADTAEAARLFDASKVHLAVVRSDEAKIGEARTIVILDRRAVILATRADPGVAVATKEGEPAPPAPLTPARLAGKRIVVASDTLGSNRALIARLLAHSGLVEPDVTLSEQPASEIAAALARNRADVAALVVDTTAPSTRALIADITKALSGAIVVGAPPGPEALAAIHRDLAPIGLAPSIFGGLQPLPAQKVTTVAITEELVADTDLADATGNMLWKSLIEIRGQMLNQRSAFEIETPPLDAVRRYMPHAGVLTGDKSTSFLETYSDQIWLGLFALGLVGSSLAGLAAWLGLYRSANPVPEQINRLVAGLTTATSVAEVEALRATLRELAGARLQEAISADAAAIDATHPTHWYELVDALAIRRRDEIEQTQ